jgi:hypothetical protein
MVESAPTAKISKLADIEDSKRELLVPHEAIFAINTCRPPRRKGCYTGRRLMALSVAWQIHCGGARIFSEGSRND